MSLKSSEVQDYYRRITTVLVSSLVLPLLDMFFFHFLPDQRWAIQVIFLQIFFWFSRIKLFHLLLDARVVHDEEDALFVRPMMTKHKMILKIMFLPEFNRFITVSRWVL